jgi:hypothetical protein
MRKDKKVVPKELFDTATVRVAVDAILSFNRDAKESAGVLPGYRSRVFGRLRRRAGMCAGSSTSAHRSPPEFAGSRQKRMKTPLAANSLERGSTIRMRIDACLPLLSERVLKIDSRSRLREGES